MSEPHETTRSKRCLVRFLCTLTVLGLFNSARAQQEFKESYRNRMSSLDKPNALMAADLFHNPTPEVVASDNRGRIIVIDAEEGRILLESQDTENEAFTAPVVGDFNTDMRLDIAVGTRDGRVLVLDSSTLEVMAMRHFAEGDVSFVEPPTVVRLPDPENESEQCDVIVLADQLGTVYALYLDEKNTLSSYWETPVTAGSTVAAPISVGHPRLRSKLDLVAPLGTGRILLIDAMTGEATKYPVREGRKVSTTVLLEDFNEDGLDDLVFTLDNGDIHVRYYEKDHDRLAEIDVFVTSNSPIGDPVLVTPSNTPPREGLIFQAGKTTLVAVKVGDDDIIRGDEKTFSEINTPLSLIPSDVGYPTLVVGFNTEVKVIPTEKWFTGVPGFEFPSHTIGEFVSNTMPIISLPTEDGGWQSHIIGMTVNGLFFGIDSGRNPVDVTTSPWMTRGATPRRNSLFDKEYFVQDRHRYDRLHVRVTEVTEEWTQAKEAGDWDEALALAKWRMGFDPLNPEYVGDYRSTWIRKNLLWLLISAVIIIAAVLGIGYLLVRFIYISRLEKRARAAVQAGKMQEAEVLYERLHHYKPTQPKVISTLAMVYISNKNYEEKTIPIFATAYEQDKENQNLLHCYARALVKANRYDKDALPVYGHALKTFSEPPLLEYSIGMCHKEAGEYDEASKRLRAALRGGYAGDNVYSALCDVYLKLNNRSAKALPVYRQQYPVRQRDYTFLECYLDACIDAKLTEGSVDSLCHAVLEQNETYVPAYCHLATIQIQKNETGRAIETIQQALQHEPDNERAITLLAQCYMVQGRTDDEACGIFHQALSHNPNDAELLRNLTEICYGKNQFDVDAVSIYQRAHEANPKDITALKALAETGRLGQDHNRVITSIEKLRELGYDDAEMTKHLADAYVSTNVIEGYAEGVLRDALRAEPENKKYATALARVLTQEGRDTSDSIPVYEKHIEAEPGDKEVGTQLVKSYIKANRYEDAAKCAQELLKAYPDDNELKRLVAMSSLYDNKIDEAVKEYQSLLERNPDDQEAQLHLAMAYAQKGTSDDEAARLFQRAIQYKPDNAELYFALARVHVVRGDAVKAVEVYQQVLKAAPGSEDQLIRNVTQRLTEKSDMLRLRWFLCEVLVAYNRLREALEQLNFIYDENPNHARNILGALERILLKDQTNIQALASRARIQVAIGEYENARDSLERAYKLQPNSPEIMRGLANVYERTVAQREDVEVRFRLGRVYYMMQEYDKALGCFQKTAQDYRWEAESVKMLGKCFMNKGMLDLALQELKKLVVDEETKELLYDLAQRYEAKKDLVGAKTVYRQLFAADIDYKDVRTRFEMLSGSTSDPIAFEKTSIVQQMSEDAKRRYELLDELGRGAMGIVYRARDKELEEVVALKILPDSMSNNPEAVRRFKVEARNARKLSHPNIVRIHDIGEEMGRKYISMEFVDGSDLKKKVKGGGALEVGEVFNYGIQIADALNYAHQLGIVHRDIKPANIMLTSADQVKITDFGIAKMLDSSAAEGTMMGAVIGTPLYMSPEQVQGVPVDNRADIYAFGIMLYELASGRPPFTEGDLAYQHIHKEPERPEECPDALWAIIKKCLEKDKDNRYATAEEIVEALKAARKEVTV